MIHKDLFANLSYMTKAQLGRVGTDLLADDRRIPGWYVRAYVYEGYTDIHKYTRVDPIQAETLAYEFDKAATGQRFPVGKTHEHVRAINADDQREARERLEALPTLIGELQGEQARLKRELGE